MPIENTQPVRFTPRGLCDAYDSTDTFLGACRKMQNLVFDQSNPEQVVPRPGVGTPLTTFVGAIAPGFVSCHITVGRYVYGMIATSLTPGVDQPFCFDLTAGALIPVSGCTAGNAENRPTSPIATGDWTPPTMAVIGVKVIVTHPGYSGSAGVFFGVIDITDPAAPAYSTANTATNALPSVPVAVANLNNRAWFACANAAYYSDVLVPTTMTNAGQAVTLGDSSPLTGLTGLPVATSSGGVVGALLAFKGSQIWQINGDAASTSTPLSTNYLSLTLGCSAPRTIAPTPLGTMFVGPDSVYLVNSAGSVAPLVNPNNATPDLSQPFNFAITPSRAAASFAGNIYRVCLPTIIDGVAGTYDYWFDTKRMRWNGPHTFTYDCASSAGTYFVLSGKDSPGMLFASQTVGQTDSAYTDNNRPFLLDLLSATFPKKGEMSMKQMIESTIELTATAVPSPYTMYAFDDKGNYIATVGIASKAPDNSIWGQNVWGDGSLWVASSLTRTITNAINWTAPLVFNKLAIEVLVVATAGIAIGTFYGRFQYLNYTLQA